MPIFECRFSNADFRMPIFECRFSNADFRMPIVECRLSNADFRMPIDRMPIFECRLSNAECLQASLSPSRPDLIRYPEKECRFSNADFRMPIFECRLCQKGRADAQRRNADFRMPSVLQASLSPSRHAGLDPVSREGMPIFECRVYCRHRCLPHVMPDLIRYPEKR